LAYQLAQTVAESVTFVDPLDEESGVISVLDLLETLDQVGEFLPVVPIQVSVLDEFGTLVAPIGDPTHFVSVVQFELLAQNLHFPD